MIIVSGCLAGINCRYDGESKANGKILSLVAEGRAVPLCPEQLGGLPTPRPPVDIESGVAVLNGSEQIVIEDNKDISDNFIKGAQEVLKIAHLLNAELLILKARSPSCGSHGVTTALLKKEGFNVITDEEWEKLNGKNT